MTHFICFDTQKAVYEQLTGDSALMALITGVYDAVPPSAEYPYVTIGESHTSDRSTATTEAYEQMTTLHIYSRARGRKAVAEIMQKLHASLHGVNLVMDDHDMYDCHYVDNEIFLQPDGLTYEGQIRFSVRAEKKT